MRLEEPFYKFPFRFDVNRLTQEVLAFPEDVWCQHPNNLEGNSFLPLVATEGEKFDDFDPPMLPTAFLEQSPYIRQVLAEFRTLIGRTRLMRLEPGHGVPPHSDSQQYWRDHTRIHVPVITNPDIRFHCGDVSVHMAAGEAWTFDNWRNHYVVNETSTRRIHLTMDTYGSNEFWSMAKPFGADVSVARPVPFREKGGTQLLYESYIGSAVMSPAELELELLRLVTDAEAHGSNDTAALEDLRKFVRDLNNEWRITWHLKGPGDEGLPHFKSLARWAYARATATPSNIRMASNGNMLLPALTETLRSAVRRISASQEKGALSGLEGKARLPHMDRPIVIVAAPRSGSTMLFEMMVANDAFVTLGDEGHVHVEGIDALNVRHRNFDSNRLTAVDARDPIIAQLRMNYARDMRTSRGLPLASLGGEMPETVRFLEKTPKNALRIPFFKAAFPDAKFIFLHRDAPSNISAIIEAWRTGRFVTYPMLPDWTGAPWSMLLIPGWRELKGKPLAEIAMRQWRDTNETILNDLAELPAEDFCSVSYEDLVANPAATLQRLYDFAGVPFDANAKAMAQRPVPLSRSTISPPDPEKWRKNEAAIMPYLESTKATEARLASLGVRHADALESSA